MAETVISTMQVRRGNLDDLPLLAPGELGYATDALRLFIGNELLTVGTGDGNTTDFQLPGTVDGLPLTDRSFVNPILYVNGAETAASMYSLQTTTITFSTAPAAGEVIEIGFNTEIATTSSINNVIDTFTMSLDADAAIGTETYLRFGADAFDIMIIDYSLRTGGSKFRVGQMRVIIDSNTTNFDVADNYNSLNGNPAVTFGGNITNGVFTLTYENLESTSADLQYTYKLWKM